jgi:hypothetical protein
MNLAMDRSVEKESQAEENQDGTADAESAFPNQSAEEGALCFELCEGNNICGEPSTFLGDE